MFFFQFTAVFLTCHSLYFYFAIDTMENDEHEFLDIEEGSVWTIKEGLSYLDEYLTKRWPGKSLPELMNNKDTRSELIMDLKTNTRLSIRTIANLLGINRGIIQKMNDSR